jgi:hypothetical protein
MTEANMDSKTNRMRNNSSSSVMSLSPGGKIQADEREKACYCALLDSEFWILNSRKENE